MSIDIQSIQSLSFDEQLLRYAELLQEPNPSTELISASAVAFSLGKGDLEKRLKLGVALGEAGDPRLKSPSDIAYWTDVDMGEFNLSVGRNLVTTREWMAFFESASYHNEDYWTSEGLKWKNADRPKWSDLANSPKSADFAIPNQPVVGVSWFEANAYALANGGRLLRFSERVQIMRGFDKRVYPWGEPFGQGNANTIEECLNRPSPVGMFLNDCTPEGVYDMAGNVSEWTANEDAGQRVIHPGAWNMSSMASWPKASRLISAAARLDNLGFRIAKDGA